MDRDPMTEREKLLLIVDRIARESGVPTHRLLIGGSGSMLLHGMDRTPGDLDVFVATRDWWTILGTGEAGLWKVFTTDPLNPRRRCDPAYLYRDILGLEVNIFSQWRIRDKGNVDPNKLFGNARMIDGVLVWPLEDTLAWKREVARPKDLDDIHLIAAWLKDYPPDD